MGRRFTHAEAESLLPKVEAAIRAAISAKANYESAERGIQALSHRIMMMGGSLVNRDEVLAQRLERDRCAQSLKGAIEGVQNLGCLVKDLDIGLIDFPTLFRGREVYLCWKLGESGIRFWHGVEEGFAGRKEIDREFLDHHRGD